MEQWDVIVAGAGIAGLTAAERLGRAGLKVLILEARDRVGGRILSVPGLTPEHAIELGAEFVHGKPKQFDEYLEEHGLKLRETDGQTYCSGKNGLDVCDDSTFALFDKLYKLNPEEFPDETFEQTLRCRFPNAQEGQKSWARRYVQGFHAGDTSRISTHSIIIDGRAEEETEGDRGFNIIGGYTQVVESLCRQFSETVLLRTSTVIESVDWREQALRVQARGADSQAAEYTAARLILTLPISILQQQPPSEGAVRFNPQLREKEVALASLSMGAVARLVLEFDSMFWEDPHVVGPKPLKNLHFLFGEDPVFPTFWTAMPLRLPLLVAWSAGPPADAKNGQSQSEVETEALAALARILPLNEAALRDRFVRSYFHDWQADPFSRGAYTYVLAGGVPAQQQLAQPIHNTLFFAGEATQSDGHRATVHGAFASGRRAADEVLRGLHS